MDLSPGPLDPKLNAAYAADVVDIEASKAPWLKVVRQEFGGQVSTHVRCDISTGAVLNIRPGAFRAPEGAAGERSRWWTSRRRSAR